MEIDSFFSEILMMFVRIFAPFRTWRLGVKGLPRIPSHVEPSVRAHRVHGALGLAMKFRVSSVTSAPLQEVFSAITKKDRRRKAVRRSEDWRL